MRSGARPPPPRSTGTLYPPTISPRPRAPTRSVRAARCGCHSETNRRDARLSKNASPGRTHFCRWQFFRRSASEPAHSPPTWGNQIHPGNHPGTSRRGDDFPPLYLWFESRERLVCVAGSLVQLALSLALLFLPPSISPSRVAFCGCSAFPKSRRDRASLCPALVSFLSTLRS